MYDGPAQFSQWQNNSSCQVMSHEFVSPLVLLDNSTLAFHGRYMLVINILISHCRIEWQWTCSHTDHRVSYSMHWWSSSVWRLNIVGKLPSKHLDIKTAYHCVLEGLICIECSIKLHVLYSYANLAKALLLSLLTF